MPRSRPWTERIAARLRDDAGSASIEFVSVGVLLLVPLVYLVLALAAVQGASFAVEGAARQASRVYVQAADDAAGRAAVERAVAITLDDYGVDRDTAAVSISCDASPCLTRLGRVTVTVTARVPLPLVPPGIDVALPAAVPLSATATERVSRFWGGR